MKITNTQPGPRGVNAIGGPVLIEPGQTADVEMSAAELKVAKATGWFDISGKAKTEPANAEPGTLEARETGGGWYAIFEGDTKRDDLKSIRKDEAEVFNAASDEDKAAYVADEANQAKD